MVDNISYICQIPSLPTGCEITALEILMRQAGFKVTKEELANKIKKSSRPQLVNGKLHADHPKDSFIGDPYSKHGFGVYSKCIVELMGQYMSEDRIQDLTGSDFYIVESIVKSGRPVMVWSTVNQSTPKQTVTWVTPNDGEFTWLAGEHALVVIGFDDDYVWTSDPAKGVIRKYSKARFINIYNKLGKQAIAIHPVNAYTSKQLKINDELQDIDALIGKDNRIWIPVKYLPKLDVNTSIAYVDGQVSIKSELYGDLVTITHKDGKTYKDNKIYDVGIMQVANTTYADTRWVKQFFDVEFNVDSDYVSN